jgi:Glycosyl hydrolase family 115
MKKLLLLAIIILALPFTAFAQEWTLPVRGSWVRTAGAPQSGDVVLARDGSGCEIVVADSENSAVKQAAVFLAGDIEKISGYRPPTVTRPSGQRVSIRLVTLSDTVGIPEGIAKQKLVGQWEAYQVQTTGNAVWLVGSNSRGTAFAAYTLSERLGIDPLYLWTGYEPEKHSTLVLKQTDFLTSPPTFKFRGFFHDDEDILPRPFDENGYPMQTGTVPRIWYERFFETALRLRMNMVAPYVRVQRPYEIQKTASDWGLIYTSHHYDSLLSNPWGFTRFGLAAARSAGTEWDWFKNREGLLNFWRGGVLENRELDAFWPVGLRGTQDRSYTFPDGISEEEKDKAYREAIEEQVKMTKDLLPPGKTPLFHFTLYTEMLPQYLSGKLEVPPEVTIVWTDDNDGRMRALPQARDQWKHGVYYHLAYFSTTTRLTKQVTHIVSPARVEEEFRRIVQAGATEYMLVNVSELREYVMEARMLAEICWDSTKAFAQPNAADRYTQWWAREYFGENAAGEVVASYVGYYQTLNNWDQISVGSNQVLAALAALGNKVQKKSATPISPDTLPALERRDAAYKAVFQNIASANARMTPDRQQYFYENVAFPLLIDWRQTTAAIKLIKAVAETDAVASRSLALSAFDDLKMLEDEIRRAERPPFEKWYRKTWIRSDESPYNLHRSYEHMLTFLVDNYLK